ncbi:GNAT family N-acetyltransferase [Mycobacterium sp. MYCO198283]|uniref:GNAT family N-acetyltransferase n=1 Tax=Mycobacterium sp. MYCO198283 TaxID=2883505 RepID=UPI001E5DE56C|nr:GNAT family N-acetyltransferase [Mycobacterium sp. MYCO198283]MCG5431586.1 GNAT family N-acetyltransferase [Mycobacterium sp. MYCO198283]
MTVTIRRAVPGDEVELTALVHELAAFEDAADECTLTAEALARALFGETPIVCGHVAEVDGQVAGGALWFVNYSTWDGEGGIYLEDLFVRPPFRRHGVGRRLLSALARECVDRGYTRLTWAVLDWNTGAIALYEAVGARHQRQWLTYRVSGPALSELAG